MTIKHTLVSSDMRVFALCSLMELYRGEAYGRRRWQYRSCKYQARNPQSMGNARGLNMGYPWKGRKYMKIVVLDGYTENPGNLS